MPFNVDMDFIERTELQTFQKANGMSSSALQPNSKPVIGMILWMFHYLLTSHEHTIATFRELFGFTTSTANSRSIFSTDVPRINIPHCPSDSTTIFMMENQSFGIVFQLINLI